MPIAYAASAAGATLEALEYELGPLDETAVEIDVLHCGICHSDLSMLNNEWGMTTFPFVGGHEVVGRVRAVGSRVSTHKVGDLVGVGWHAGYCHSCPQCQEGDQNLCSQAQGTIVGRFGGFAEVIQVDAASAIAIPEGMKLEAVGPLFCGGITVFNPMLQFHLSPLSKVGVVGIGGLGHLALQFLNAWGCEVTAFTSSPEKAEEARKLGAHKIINSKDNEEISSAAGYFDYIISTVNVKLDWNLYLAALKPKGRLHFVGATLEPLDINVFSLITAQRVVSGSPVGSPGSIAKMLEFANRHNIETMIEVFPFEKINEALKHLEEGKARYRVVLSRA